GRPAGRRSGRSAGGRADTPPRWRSLVRQAPRADLRSRPGRDLVGARPRRPRSSVPVLVQPGHLDRLEDLLVGSLGVIGEARKLDHPAIEIREPDRQRIEIRMALVEGDRDVLVVPPGDHFGISTTTLPRTTA